MARLELPGMLFFCKFSKNAQKYWNERYQSRNSWTQKIIVFLPRLLYVGTYFGVLSIFELLKEA